MRHLAERVYAHLDAQGIAYCLLRDDPLAELPADRAELDILVAPGQLPAVSRALAAHGFAQLASRGHAPHRFFVAYDAATDGWLKLDVVDALAFGAPSHALRTELAVGLLRRRQRRGPAYVPAPEDALVSLLLHCLLDKRAFPYRHRERLTTLCDQVRDPATLSGQLADLGTPELAWPRLAEHVRAGRWSLLAEQGPGLWSRLAGRDRLGVAGRTARDRALRQLDRLLRMVRPRAPRVALLAPDGAGKSTLAASLADTLYLPTRLVYMGYYQRGALPRAGAGHRPKGLGAAGRLVRQWGRYLQARWHQGRGRIVLFDRYGYDLGLPGRHRERGLRRARNWLLANACPAPDLVLLLDAPGQVLFARKGEHDPEHLEQQRQAYLALRARLPQLVVLDATRPADEVRRDATTWVWAGYADRNQLRQAGAQAVVDDRPPWAGQPSSAPVTEEPC